MVDKDLYFAFFTEFTYSKALLTITLTLIPELLKNGIYSIEMGAFRLDFVCFKYCWYITHTHSIYINFKPIFSIAFFSFCSAEVLPTSTQSNTNRTDDKIISYGAYTSNGSFNETAIWLMNTVNNDNPIKLRCIKCDTKKDGKNCMKVEDPIYLSNCASSFGQCYTTIIGGIVHRGCVGDELFPDQPSIGNPDYETHVCNDNRYCNQHENITDTCIICSGNTDECKKPTLTTERTCSFDQQGKGCFLRIQRNGTYERGCAKDLSNDERNLCNRLGSDYCQSCIGRNCNKKSELYQQCYFCNGTNDKNCFETPDKRMTINCISYANRCLVGADANGYAHRQCSSTVENDLVRFPNGYELCDDNLCNTQIFPKDWTRCFRCTHLDGGEGCDHPSASMVPQKCRVLNDLCYIYGVEGVL